MTEATLQRFRDVERRMKAGTYPAPLSPVIGTLTGPRTAGRTSKSYCGKGVVLYADTEISVVVQTVVRCHRYDCQCCGPARAAEARGIARSGRPERLLTLTLRRNTRAPIRGQVRFLFTSWTELVRRIRRHFPMFEYCKFLELTKAGTPHLHVLCRGDYIPIRWIRHQWQQITGAFIVYLQRIDRTSGAVHECTKYICKTAAALNTMFPHLHVFSHSKNWCIDVDSEPPDPQHHLVPLGFFRLNVADSLDRWAEYGFSIDSDRESPGQWTLSLTGTPCLDAIRQDLGSFARDVGLMATVALWLAGESADTPQDLSVRLEFYRGHYNET